MATLRRKKGRRTRETALTSPPHQADESAETQKPSTYEQSREQRIKENRERMEKLGIRDLSIKLNSSGLPRRPIRRENPNKATPKILSMGPPEPTRRSSRLQKAEPVYYSEMAMEEVDRPKTRFVREVGSRMEAYTEAHEKLLGSTDMSWTFFVDGYDNDGRRIYDSINGKTCHQCRQKTLGHRTQCSECNMVQGQFCGDCLYMRYGEHVLEAKQNPKWICPVCRGICNCSLCRQAKGWAPTGTLYRKISQLGFKSVAHYLIQTRRLDASTGKDMGAVITDDHHIPEPEGKKDDEFEREEVPAVTPKSSSNSTITRSIECSGCDVELMKSKGEIVDSKVSPAATKTGTVSKLRKKRLVAVPSPDSIGGRLRQRHRKDEIVDSKISPAATKTGTVSKLRKKRPVAEPSPDSIGARLRQTHRKDEIVDGKVSPAAATTGNVSKLRNKRPVAEPSPDSIAARLRQRHRKDNNREVN